MIKKHITKPITNEISIQSYYPNTNSSNILKISSSILNVTLKPYDNSDDPALHSSSITLELLDIVTNTTNDLQISLKAYQSCSET